jgi:hypothetical protein
MIVTSVWAITSCKCQSSYLHVDCITGWRLNDTAGGPALNCRSKSRIFVEEKYPVISGWREKTNITRNHYRQCTRKISRRHICQWVGQSRAHKDKQPLTSWLMRTGFSLLSSSEWETTSVHLSVHRYLMSGFRIFSDIFLVDREVGGMENKMSHRESHSSVCQLFESCPSERKGCIAENSPMQCNAYHICIFEEDIFYLSTYA